VTPEDSDVMLGSLMNIDWDVAEVDAANKEARMFDAILQCVDEQYSVDWSHVHVAGISMGGFCTDVIGTLRSGVVASIATWSGAYGSNEVNLTGSMLAALVSWPEHDPVNTYVQLIAHGDVTDTYDFFVETLHFDVWGDNDRQYLNGLGHDVIFCNHGQGHTIPDDFHGDKLVTFFADHPLGTTDTPYAVDGLPTDLATYCTISESTE